MALKALDQRMANSSAPGGSSEASAPRPPPAAASSEPDGPPMPSSPVRSNSGSIGSVDLGKGKAREDATE